MNNIRRAAAVLACVAFAGAAEAADIVVPRSPPPYVAVPPPT